MAEIAVGAPPVAETKKKREPGFYLDELEAGEEVFFFEALRFEGADPFAVAVTSRALYLPQEDDSGWKSAWRLRRLPLQRVQSVRVTTSPSGLRHLIPVGATVSSIAGLAYVACRLWRGADVAVWAVSAAVMGLAAGFGPLICRGLPNLRVDMGDEVYTWNSPAILDRLTRERVRTIFRRLTAACERARIPVQASPTAG
jgi:hypothetical protein